MALEVCWLGHEGMKTMSDSEEKRRKKKREEERKRQVQKRIQESLEARKFRNIHERHKRRRKKDCMIGMPFVIAFQGDPAGAFYCNDIHSYELIPRTDLYPSNWTPLGRLKFYQKHHVVQIAKKVLIYKAI